MLGLLGAVMMNLLAPGSESVARELVSARALLAAESGAQRALNEVFKKKTESCGLCRSGGNTLPYLNWYDSCSASVYCCTRTPASDHPRTYYTFTSTGSCGPVGEKAVRVIKVQARD